MTATIATIAAASVASTVATVVPAKPTGTTTGDLLLACCWSDNQTSTWTSPGFTAEANPGAGTGVLWRIADGSEGSTFTFTRAVNTINAACVVVIRIDAGTFDPADPIDTVGLFSTGSAASFVIPSQSPTGTDNLFVQVLGRGFVAADSWTPPGGTTERDDAAAAGTGIRYAVGDEVVGAGATGTRTWTHTASSGRGFGLTVNPVPVANQNSAFLALL